VIETAGKTIIYYDTEPERIGINSEFLASTYRTSFERNGYPGGLEVKTIQGVQLSGEDEEFIMEGLYCGVVVNGDGLYAGFLGNVLAFSDMTGLKHSSVCLVGDYSRLRDTARNQGVKLIVASDGVLEAKHIPEVTSVLGKMLR
tara:strand:- start:1001 stop:1432 length:432 start_codon:yes stop_codon:yes gene_type:complete